MKRIISVVLAIAICCGMFAVMAMAAETFSDVKANDWFANDVRYVSENALMNGVGDGRFGPNETTTRAMVATILWRLDMSPKAKVSSGYADVPDGKWYSDAVAWMKEVGLTNGKGNNMFGTEDPITREELATFLFRYWRTKDVEEVIPADLGKFVDGKKVNAWAKEAVSWAAGYPILSGKPGPAIDPQGRATRAELAAMLHRYVNQAMPIPPKPVDPDAKVGVILVGDKNEAYSNAHILGICKACEELGLSKTENIVWKYNIEEDESCLKAIEDCIRQGCMLIFTNAYGHQDYARIAAEHNPNVQIVALTGDTAAFSGLKNYYNAFTNIYEARYVAGVVAGMKINELKANGKLINANKDFNGNVKVGYVGAYPYAEVVSGYTAFYLGIKSVCPKVVMDVLYTSSWFDVAAEKAAAEQLIGDGCVIIGQHADSTGAPSACEAALKAGGVVYSVGYNIDMLPVAPNAALVSPTNQWDAYFKYAIQTYFNGGKMHTDWSEGFNKNAVALTVLGPNVAEGTAEKVAQVIDGIKYGSIHPFDTKTFTIDGRIVTGAFATDSDGDWINDCDQAVFEGYFHESYFRSAPYFSLRIDGITELN